MKTKLNPSSLYWASFNRFELRLLGQAVTDICQSGPNDEAVAFWAPEIKAQMLLDNFAHQPTPEKIREELSDYGAWSVTDLFDDAANWRRLVWIAAWNIAEEIAPDCSEPVKNEVRA